MHSSHSSSIICVVIYLLLSGILSAHACLHGPKSASTPVKQSAQEVIILHDGKTEELILSINYKEGQVSSLAWIIPVPEVPTHYDVADSKLFRQIHNWVSLKRNVPIPKSRRRRGSGGSTNHTVGLRLLATSQVGPFKIQPIQGSGSAAIPALTQWLTQRGFEEPSHESLAYYVEREWTFLAIHITPEKNSSQLTRRGSLPPLRITFPTSRVIYPLKFSTHMGIFSTRIHLFTKEPLPHEAFSGARARGFEVVNRGQYLKTARFSPHPLSVNFPSFRPRVAPRTLKPLIKERLGEVSRVYLSVLLNKRVNETRVKRFKNTKWRHVKFAPELWPEDLAIPAPERGERLMGSITRTSDIKVKRPTLAPESSLPSTVSVEGSAPHNKPKLDISEDLKSESDLQSIDKSVDNTSAQTGDRGCGAALQREAHTHQIVWLIFALGLSLRRSCKSSD